MTHEYWPGASYGPFRFGMTPDQVIGFAGPPVSCTRADAHQAFELIRDNWGDDAKRLYAADIARFVSEGAFDNTRPDLPFQDGAGLVFVRSSSIVAFEPNARIVSIGAPTIRSESSLK